MALKNKIHVRVHVIEKTISLIKNTTMLKIMLRKRRCWEKTWHCLKDDVKKKIMKKPHPSFPLSMYRIWAHQTYDLIWGDMLTHVSPSQPNPRPLLGWSCRSLQTPSWLGEASRPEGSGPLPLSLGALPPSVERPLPGWEVEATDWGLQVSQRQTIQASPPVSPPPRPSSPPAILIPWATLTPWEQPGNGRSCLVNMRGSRLRLFLDLIIVIFGFVETAKDPAYSNSDDQWERQKMAPLHTILPNFSWNLGGLQF